MFSDQDYFVYEVRFSWMTICCLWTVDLSLIVVVVVVVVVDRQPPVDSPPTQPLRIPRPSASLTPRKL